RIAHGRSLCPSMSGVSAISRSARSSSALSAAGCAWAPAVPMKAARTAARTRDECMAIVYAQRLPLTVHRLPLAVIRPCVRRAACGVRRTAYGALAPPDPRELAAQLCTEVGVGDADQRLAALAQREPLQIDRAVLGHHPMHMAT